MNNINLLGRLTRDPELRANASGTSVATFTLAVQKDFKNEDGGYDANFINCVAFKHNADFISAYFHKGEQMAVSGKLNTRTYQDKDNRNVYITEVIVNNAYFTGNKKEEKKEDNLEDFEDIRTTDDFDLPF